MKHLLSSTAFIVLNKNLARRVGINCAVYLSDLISKEEYFISQGMTDGWFYNTEDNIERDTTLTPYQQRKCLKTLKNEEFIKVKRKGIPAKQFFKINEEQVINFLKDLSLTNLTSINNNKKIKITNKYFKKPSIDEVILYCVDKNYTVIAAEFYDFYESKGWKVGKTKMKDWKAAVRNWERRGKNKPKTTSKIDTQLNEYIKGKEYL